MTVAQAAAALGVSEEHVRRLLRRGELIGVSYGGKAGWRLDPQYVAEVASLWSASRAAQEALRAPKRSPRKGARSSD
jgi:excisionase family DNA binding protein